MRLGGVEPPTPALGEPRSIHLSYRRIFISSFYSGNEPAPTSFNPNSMIVADKAQISLNFLKRNLHRSKFPLSKK